MLPPLLDRPPFGCRPEVGGAVRSFRASFFSVSFLRAGGVAVFEGLLVVVFFNANSSAPSAAREPSAPVYRREPRE